MKRPARRVIYGSVKARLSRLVLGVALAVVTLWIVLPVLASDKGPPAPVGLAVGTDAIDEGLHEGGSDGTRPSVLDLNVHANGCTNPVTVEGTLLRSTDTWYAERRGRFSAAPQQAMITLTGARVRRLVVGVEEGTSARLLPTIGTVRMLSLAGKPVVVHNHLLPLVRRGDTTTAILNAPQWAQAMTPLGFVITADLIRPAGLDSCYLDIPQLFDNFEPGTGVSMFRRAETALEHISEHVPKLAQAQTVRVSEFEPPPATDGEDIGAAEVDASVSGRFAVQGTLGSGGAITAAGVRYLCHSYVAHKPPVTGLDARIAPEFTEPSANPNCSGVPLFQTVYVVSDTTRRLFAAGIIGALAATLIIEALFLGETEPSEGSAASAGRRRWRKR